MAELEDNKLTSLMMCCYESGSSDADGEASLVICPGYLVTITDISNKGGGGETLGHYVFFLFQKIKIFF